VRHQLWWPFIPPPSFSFSPPLRSGRGPSVFIDTIVSFFPFASLPLSSLESGGKTRMLLRTLLQPFVLSTPGVFFFPFFPFPFPRSLSLLLSRDPPLVIDESSLTSNWAFPVFSPFFFSYFFFLDVRNRSRSTYETALLPPSKACCSKALPALEDGCASPDTFFLTLL